MTRPKLIRQDAKTVRDALMKAVQLAEQIHDQEKNLVAQLQEIDQKRFYVRFGCKSLMGFCIHWLRFSKVQSQRIATLVRRHEPSVD